MMTKEEKQYKDLLMAVKTFLFDVDEALERETEDQELIMTNYMWLQIEVMRKLVKDKDWFPVDGGK